MRKAREVVGFPWSRRGGLGTRRASKAGGFANADCRERGPERFPREIRVFTLRFATATLP